MKKLFLMAVAAVLATMNVNAQNERKNELSIAYGFGANTDIILSLFKGMFTGKQLDYWGPISAEYFYRPQNKLGIGAVVAIGGCKWDDEGDAKSTYYTLMPALKYNWMNWSHVSMYSKAAIGATLSAESGTSKDETSVDFNWQATFFGVEFGSSLRGFVETGFGEQGIFLGGLRYKF